MALKRPEIATETPNLPPKIAPKPQAAPKDGLKTYPSSLQNPMNDLWTSKEASKPPRMALNLPKMVNKRTNKQIWRGRR